MLKEKFVSEENAIASYDAVDIMSGTGITNFYAGSCGTPTTYLLSNNTFYSDTITTTAALGGGAAAKVIDIDFDTMINRPTTIQGRVVVNVPFGISTQNGTCYIIAKVRKWDGTTETEIANATSTSHASTASAPDYWMTALLLDIPPTTFEIGQYLRLTIEGWGTHTGAGNMLIAHDPMGRGTGWDTAEAPTILVFQVPKRIDLT